MGASNVIYEIRRSTIRRFVPEEKIRILVEGPRGDILVFSTSITHVVHDNYMRNEVCLIRLAMYEIHRAPIRPMLLV